MTLHARFGEINKGDLVWYWCFRDSKRKPGVVLDFEVSDNGIYTFVAVQQTDGSQWYKSHSLMLTKEQIDKEIESDGAKSSRRDLSYAGRNIRT
tara:strand:+ start:232 stop:513 length:282 start_codon:yes stop_codon:yes gene_type:complete